jgi:hypothetical protein
VAGIAAVGSGYYAVSVVNGDLGLPAVSRIRPDVGQPPPRVVRPTDEEWNAYLAAMRGVIGG